MTSTTRLHYDDPLRLRFTATVLAHGAHRERPSVILDETAFYPESGGQMADRGTLADAPVADVQLDGEGRVHHVLDGERPAVGASVEGTIDQLRRRQHMAMHTGQHCLSAAVLQLLDATTVSSRLGETLCTLDVDRAGLTLAQARDAAARVNRLVDEDRPVRQFFPTDTELADLALRKPPGPKADRLRVVEVAGYDVTPCGGTHVQRTGQIQLLHVLGVERYKGGTRVSFLAGPRARTHLETESGTLRSVAAKLKCAPPEVPQVLESLEGRLADARAEAGRLGAALAERWAEDLARTAGPHVVAVLDGVDAGGLKALAERLLSTKSVVALAGGGAGHRPVLIAAREDAGVNAGQVLQAVAAAVGGRGGGRPGLAQGRIPADAAWATLVDAELSPNGA